MMTANYLKESRWHGLVRETIFAFVTLAFAYQFTTLRFTLNQEYERATLSSLLEFKADLPFQYRVLVPWLVHIIGPLLPQFSLPSNLWVTTSVGIGSARAVVAVEFCSIALLVLAFRWYLTQFMPRALLSIVLSFMIFYGLLFNFIIARYAPFWYPYDMPGLMFFTVGLSLLYRRSWVFFYPLFVLATLNRETSIFLTIVLLVTSIGTPQSKLATIHCAIQVVIWFGIKFLLHQLYGSNPGTSTFVENHFQSNLSLLSSPKSYVILVSSIGYLWIPSLVFFKLTDNHFARRSMLVAIPFVLIVMFTGSILELRVYQELIPIFLTGFVLQLLNLIRDWSATSMLGGTS